MSKLTPKYKLWEAIDVAISLGTRAIEEIRTLARTPGPPGLDGLGFDDLEIQYDGERTFSFVLQKGDRVKRFDFVTPINIDRGVYKEGTSYVRGDGVSFGGSYWLAQKDTDSKPGHDATWRLAVKKGRDSKDSVKI
jgi:hypothetical protein